MANDAEIDLLVERLSRMPGARTGRGPRHPRTPDPAPEQRLREFLHTYPQAGDDAGYVAFLERYAGAIVEDAGGTRIVDLFGFGDAGTDMLEMDGPVVDENGFLVFAQCMYYPDGGVLDMYEHDFAFSVADDREPGVYHSQSTLHTPSRGFSRYADDFAAWLRDLLDHDGWYERPALD